MSEGARSNVLRDRTGLRYGKFTVIERGPSAKSGASWVLRCECGETRVVTACNLNRRDPVCRCERCSPTAEELKERRRRNNLQQIENKRAWLERNREQERLKASERRWRQYATDPTVRAKAKEAYEKRKHTERYRELNKQICGRRWARTKSWTIPTEEWLALKELFGNRCAYCLKEAKLTLEHVVPLKLGGEHSLENIVPACMPCNSRKRARTLLRCAQRGIGVIAPRC